MKRYSTSLFTLLTLVVIGIGYLAINAFYLQDDSSNIQPKYSQVRIFAVNENDFNKMVNAGLIIDHASSKPGHYLDAWLSEYEISLLQKSGVSYQVLVDDWMEYYNSQPKMTQAEVTDQMNQAYEKDNITHSIYGSMGGYMTYTEVVAKLDSMRMWYPQFISPKFSLGQTYENRDMWCVRVTKNPDAPTGRPEVMLHALIHAREPESMETQFYYMFWLFENYNTDPLARYILDNREIYWIPVFNADGYVHNQTTNPSGGGMWRANKHLTSPPSLTCGPVDPNRNFGIYQFWNSPNNGSGTNSCEGGQGTYRGTLPFSELETQNIKTFVNSRSIKTAFSAHTYGNYLIKPWCWQDPIGTPDDAIYTTFLNDMKAVSGYTAGFPSQTVGYKVRGGTDDWYYNDSGHAKIFSITPETGTSFWPPQNQIIPLAQGMLHSNQYITLVAGPYVNYVSSNFNQSTYTPGSAGTFRVRYKNKGVMTANNTKIILTPANSNVTIPTQQFTVNVATNQQDSSTFNFTLAAGAPNNCYVPCFLQIKQDTSTIYTQGVYIPVGTPTANVVLNDAAANFTNWTAGGTAATWNISTAQSHSAPSSFTESPSGNYTANCDLHMTLITPINVSVNPVVTLSFWHRYTTEIDYDFCKVEVSKDNGLSWQQVASYHGTLSTWTQQTFDISSYANGTTSLKVRFRLTSDGSLQYDGWYVDDVVITTYCTGTITGVNGNNGIPLTYKLEQNFPNPFNPATTIKYQLAKDTKVKLTVYDVLGRMVSTLVNANKPAGSYEMKFDASNFASGLYFYKLEAGDYTEVKKMMLVK
jgi:carboxypeptidase T